MNCVLSIMIVKNSVRVVSLSLLGVPVILGGTGRFDRSGFTLDSNTRKEYLHNLETHETYPPLWDGHAAERIVEVPMHLQEGKSCNHPFNDLVVFKQACCEVCSNNELI